MKGDNILAYTADSGAEKLYFSVENNVIYEGYKRGYLGSG